MEKYNQKTVEEVLKDFIDLHKDEEPVYKGCPNKGNPCHCTGICREIVGWRPKHKEHTWINL